MSIEKWDWDWAQELIASMATRAPASEEVGQALTGLAGIARARFLRRGMQHSDAEDLASETLRKIIKSGKTFHSRGEGSFRAWIYKVADNVFLTWCDKQQKRPADVVDPVLFDAMASAPVDDTDAVAESEPTTLSYVVREAFGFLSRRDRELLHWRIVDDVPSAEIAQRLGISDAAVRKGFERAKSRLTERLTSSLPQINDWRVSLIHKRHSGHLTDTEQQEFANLQEIASAHQHLVAPLPLD